MNPFANDPTLQPQPSQFDQPNQESRDGSSGKDIETGDLMAAVEGGGTAGGVAGEMAGSAAEAVGDALGSAGGCLEGLGGCSLAVVIGLFLTAQVAFAVFR